MPWGEHCDYPLARKFIKEKISKTMAEVRVLIPSFPEGTGISQKESNDFFDWLSEDLKGYAIVERLNRKFIPPQTKWSGNKSDGNLNYHYSYPFEYCLDNYSGYDYIARIETDFYTKDWEKIEKILEKDFDLVTLGTGLKKHNKTEIYRPNGDISFFVIRKDFLLSLEDLSFNDVERRNIHLREPHGGDGVDNPEDYTLFDRNKHLAKSDDKKSYSDFQWMLALTAEKSDKVYVIDPNKVLYHHFLGKTVAYISYTRGIRHATDSKYDALLRYINYMKSEMDINNYNLYPPYKKFIEKYYDEYGKQ